MKIRCFPLLLLILFIAVGCTAPKVREQGYQQFASFDDFKFGPEGGVDLVWSTRRIYDAQDLKEALQNYDSLMLDQTWVVVGENMSGTVDSDQALRFSRQMIREIKNRLGHEFKLVKVPSDNTLRLSLALTELETSQPILAVTSRFLPEGRTAATVSKVVMDSETNTGRVTAELLVSDARSREPLIAVIDRHFDSQTVDLMIASPDASEKAISLWADRLWTTLSYWNWIKERTAPQ